MKKNLFKLDASKGTLSENDSKLWFSTVGLAVCAFMVLSYGTTILVSMLISAYAPWIYESSMAQSAVSLVAQYSLSVPALIYILKKLPKESPASDKISFGQGLGALCIAFTFMTVGNTAGQYIAAILSALLGRDLINPVASSTLGVSWVENLIFVGILAPIIEELIFRKLICDRLIPLGEGYAIVISALIFGLVHGNFYQFPYAFLVGLLFGGIYVRTGKIIYTMVIHAVINIGGAVLVPWLYGKLAPVLTDEFLQKAQEVLLSENIEAIEAFNAELMPYMLPVVIYMAYLVLSNIAAIAGVFVLTKKMRRVKLRAGLLPPSKEGRIANIFCNVGVAAAIAVFAGVFILSLL